MKRKDKINSRSMPRKILNFFIGLSGLVVFLFIILVGYMQTSTFREWLRNELVTTINKSINGNLSIEKLDGTIITSIYLSNISLTTETDTILTAKSIGLKAQPFDAVFGKIYLTEVIIDQLDLDLRENQKGMWNIATLGKKDSIATVDSTITKETTIEESSPFPFQIIVNDLRFTNLSLSNKSFEHLNKNVKYETMEGDDLQIKDLFLNARLAVKFDGMDIRLLITRLAFNPNFNNFELKDFRGAFVLTENFAEINNLHFMTDDATFDISTRMDSINLFSSLDIDDFEKYPIKLNLKVDNFEFDDLSSFLEPITILNGSADLELDAEGKFGDFNVNKLVLDYGNSHFELDGRITDLNNPAHFVIDAKYYNCYSDFNDVINLMHKIDMPKFTTLKLKNFEGTFVGEPTNFHTVGTAELTEGKFKFDTKLNLQNEFMEYDIKLDAQNINVNPVTPLTSNLNVIGSAKGRGVTPEELESEFEFNIINSTLEGIELQSVYLFAEAKDHIFDIILDSKINGADISLDGDLNFKNKTNPFYNLKGVTKNLSIENFTDTTDITSNLNFKFEALGRDLDIDNMIGSFKVNLDSSMFRNQNIYGNILALELNRFQEKRFINFRSDFLDLLVTGDFKITDAIDLITYESKTIGELIEQKYGSFSPITKDTMLVSNEKMPDIVNQDIEIDYEFDFKDFEIIQLIIGSDQLDIEGYGEGVVKNNSENFSISSNVDFSHFIMVKDGNATYFNDITSDFHFSRNNKIKKFENLFGSVSLTGEKFYSGSEFSNLNFDLVFNHSQLYYYFSGDFQNYLQTIAEGSLIMTPNYQQLNIETLELGHNDLWWTNQDTINIDFDSSSVIFNDIALKFDESILNIDGNIKSDGSQNISISLKDLSGQRFGNFLSVAGTNNFESKITLDTEITGTVYSPSIKLNFLVDSIKFKELDLGKIKTQLDYKDKKITTALFLQNKLMSENAPLLSIIGDIPIDLGFIGVDERIPVDQKINLLVKTNEFNINAFGDVLPNISDQSGFVNTKIKFSGTLTDPTYEGYINLNDGKFKLALNNLVYETNCNITLSDKEIFCDTLNIKNISGTNFPGELVGTGTLNFVGTKLEDANVTLDGNISLMSFDTRVVNPELYGNLFVSTEDSWKLDYKNNTITFIGDILLEETNLVYTLNQNQQARNNVGFNYKILEEEIEVDSARALFLELVSEIRKSKIDSSDGYLPEIDFDYQMNIKTEKEAQLVLNILKAFGQKIIAYSVGEMYMEKRQGVERAQGSFQLLDGSRMEFIKTFVAEGDLRFESDLTDPYLDIIATYNGSYIPPSNIEGASEDVAIRMRVEGPLSELSNNFGINSKNISVYLGRNNIENNIVETKYDESDAISFIILGKFRDEITSSDNTLQNNSLSQAFTFLSPVISNYFSSATQNIVDDVQISQHGDYTRLGIAGKYGDFRYRLGGTTAELNNLTNANVLVQYYFNRRISARLERKNPIIYYMGDTRKINEFGLRYKFDF